MCVCCLVFEHGNTSVQTHVALSVLEVGSLAQCALFRRFELLAAKELGIEVWDVGSAGNNYRIRRTRSWAGERRC